MLSQSLLHFLSHAQGQCCSLIHCNRVLKHYTGRGHSHKSILCSSTFQALLLDELHKFMSAQIFLLSLYTVCMQSAFCSTLPVPLKATLLSTLKQIFLNLSPYGTECVTRAKHPMAIYEAYIIVFTPTSFCSNYLPHYFRLPAPFVPSIL